MTDRKLLELAAKAAGYVLTPNWSHSDDPFCIGGEPWNPLTDDGDAFRLATKLSLTVRHHTDEIGVLNMTGTVYEDVARVGDIYAATRRAIVRAAAEIGREMP